MSEEDIRREILIGKEKQVEEKYKEDSAERAGEKTRFRPRAVK